MKSKKDALHQPSVLSEMDTPQGDLDDQAGTEHVNGDTSWTSRLLKVRSDLGETVNRLRSDLAQLDGDPRWKNVCMGREISLRSE